MNKYKLMKVGFRGKKIRRCTIMTSYDKEDLERRVEKLLKGHNVIDLQYSTCVIVPSASVHYSVLILIGDV